MDSSSIRTPIVGLITEDIYHAGRLIIPAGTEVHGSAQVDRARERIASANRWTLVWQTGEELRLSGIALDREKDSNGDGWGITDGSAGLRGRLVKTDDMAEIKLFAATFLSGAASSLTDREQTIFGSITSPTLRNAPLKGAQDVLGAYAKQIYDSIQRDGFYVRVPAGKQFYLYVTQTIDNSDATVGGTLLDNRQKFATQALLDRGAKLDETLSQLTGAFRVTKDLGEQAHALRDDLTITQKRLDAFEQELRKKQTDTLVGPKQNTNEW